MLKDITQNITAMKVKGYLAASIAAIALISVGFTGCAPSKEMVKQKNEKVAKQVEDQNYTFEAATMFPARGTMKSLTGGYSLKVSKDTVEAYLPFFGRAYRAPMSPDDSGIKFTSTKFEYSVEPAKKDGWNVTIKTKDVANEYVLNLYISSSGRSNLQVTSTDKEGISFSGNLKE